MDGQGTRWRRNIAENFNRLSRAHERYRQTTEDRRQTDGRTMTYSEHELEFTFANKIILSIFAHIFKFATLLQRLPVRQWVEFKLAVLVYKAIDIMASQSLQMIASF